MTHQRANTRSTDRSKAHLVFHAARHSARRDRKKLRDSPAGETFLLQRRAIAGMIALLLVLSLSPGCSRLDSIEYAPRITPEAFLSSQPFLHVRLASVEFILIQPGSTVIVYFVALLTLVVGLRFLRGRNHSRARWWWGIGLLLSGAGAFLAGTSYQAFGYEIKCAGREFCTWTSWWEVAYLLFSEAGMAAMLIAVGYSCAAGRLRRDVAAFAVVSAATYGVAVLIGALVPVRFLVSFECLMLAASPAVGIALYLPVRAYRSHRDPLALALLKTWAGFVAVIAAYVIAAQMGITQKLWSRGIWFSENDVLHVGMVLWILYVGIALPRKIKDLLADSELSGHSVLDDGRSRANKFGPGPPG